MNKINITSGILLIYTIVMGVIGWPGNELDANYWEYFGILGLCVVVILLLRYVQIKRFKIREQVKNEQKKQE